MNQIFVRKLVRDGIISPKQAAIIELQMQVPRRLWPRLLGGFIVGLVLLAVTVGAVAFITVMVRLIVGV